MGWTNIWHFIFMVILTQQVISGDEIRLDQSPAVIKKLQESVKISCKISGFTMTSFYMHWVRQRPGKALEWIGRVDSGSSDDPEYADSMKDHFTLTEDVSADTQYLEAKRLREEDTAVYYCARVDSDAFDYWGKGTSVTVSSAQPSAPQSIFGLSQCGSDTDGFLTIGCMARGFSPANSLTFKWTDPAGKPVNDFVQYPAFTQGGDNTKVSHLRVKKSDFDANKRYKCEAENSVGKKDTSPAPLVPKVKPPQRQEGTLTLTLKTPIQRELFLSNKVILQAVVTGNEREAVEKASVSCGLENESLNTVSDAVQTLNENSLFMKILNVTVNTEKWFDCKIVTCAISDKNIKQEIHFEKGDTKKPNVVVYADDKDPKHVSLVCEVTSPQLGDVYIMWTVGDGKYKEAPTSAPIRQEDSTSVLSILKVSAEEYEKSVISCAVKHANMKNTSSPLIKSAGKSKSKCPECPACTKDY